MNLQVATQAVLEELSRMRSEGISRVFIQDETLGILEDLLSPNSSIDKPVPENKVSKDRTNIPEPLSLEEPAPSQVSSSKDIEIENEFPSITFDDTHNVFIRHGRCCINITFYGSSNKS